MDPNASPAAAEGATAAQGDQAAPPAATAVPVRGADTPELATAAGLTGATPADLQSTSIAGSSPAGKDATAADPINGNRILGAGQVYATRPLERPTCGRTVHYVLPDGDRKGQHRAAIVTSNFDGTNVAPTAAINLTVFHDQSGDHPGHHSGGGFVYQSRAWSVPFDPSGDTPGTWHWPERV